MLLSTLCIFVMSIYSRGSQVKRDLKTDRIVPCPSW